MRKADTISDRQLRLERALLGKNAEIMVRALDMAHHMGGTSVEVVDRAKAYHAYLMSAYESVWPPRKLEDETE